MAIDTILSSPFSGPEFETRPAPASAGVGLKAEHVDQILATEADVGFFEIHAENYMGGGGYPHYQLAEIRSRYPVSLHGVGMSIGGENPINKDHLARFKALVDHYKPALVSEHLAWSTHDDIFFNDLLPVPYTDQTLARVVDHVKEVQDAIGRQIMIENPSTYVTFDSSTIAEAEFMAAIAERAECKLLFDVNNVFVSATNHGTSAEDYIDNYPLELVGEIHLAGHATDSDDAGAPLLIDAHDREVSSDVWALYERTLRRTGPLPSLVEWDNDIPKWSALLEEARRAETVLARVRADQPAGSDEIHNANQGGFGLGGEAGSAKSRQRMVARHA